MTSPNLTKSLISSTLLLALRNSAYLTSNILEILSFTITKSSARNSKRANSFMPGITLFSSGISSGSYDFNISLTAPLTSIIGTSSPCGGAGAPCMGAISLKKVSMSLWKLLAVESAEEIFLRIPFQDSIDLVIFPKSGMSLIL